MQSLSIALLPVIVLLLFTYFRDKYEKEPILLLLKAFLAGVISAIICLLFGEIWDNWFPAETVSTFTSAFIEAAIPEETIKFTFLYLLIWHNKEFDEQFDGIVYATYISLGFACLENILYVYSYGMEVGITRAIFSVPAHFLFAIVMGYYFSLARFSTQKRTILLLSSLTGAILVHGIFNSILIYIDLYSIEEPLVALLYQLLFLAFNTFLWISGMNKIKELVESSNFKKEDPGENSFHNPE